MRLAEFTVLSNHLHLIVEADGSISLARGVQGLCIRLAKALNAALSRCGKVFADHYHSRLLATPTELCGAIRYLRGNAARHYGETGPDRFSSDDTAAGDLLAAPVGWLLRIGWRLAPQPHPPRADSCRFSPAWDTFLKNSHEHSPPELRVSQQHSPPA
jgi:hypothetical protein